MGGNELGAMYHMSQMMAQQQAAARNAAAAAGGYIPPPPPSHPHTAAAAAADLEMRMAAQQRAMEYNHMMKYAAPEHIKAAAAAAAAAGEPPPPPMHPQLPPDHHIVHHRERGPPPPPGSMHPPHPPHPPPGDRDGRPMMPSPGQRSVDGRQGDRGSMDRAHMERANMERANMERVNMERANMERVNMERANMERVNMERVNMERANMERVNLERATMERMVVEKQRGAPVDSRHYDPRSMPPVDHRGVPVDPRFAAAASKRPPPGDGRPVDNRHKERPPDGHSMRYDNHGRPIDPRHMDGPPPPRVDSRGVLVDSRGVPVDNRILMDSRVIPADSRRVDNRDKRIPVDSRGMPVDNRGMAVDSCGMPVDNRGMPVDNRRTPVDNRAPVDTRGIPADHRVDNRGIPVDSRRIPVDSRGIPVDNRGVPMDNRRIPVDARGIPSRDSSMERGPPSGERGMPMDPRGPPMDPRGIPMDSRPIPHHQDVRASLQLSVETHSARHSVEMGTGNMPPPPVNKPGSRERPPPGPEKPEYNDRSGPGRYKESLPPPPSEHPARPYSKEQPRNMYPDRYKPQHPERPPTGPSPHPPPGNNMKRVPAPVPYQSLETKEIGTPPQRELAVKPPAEKPFKRKLSPGGGEQPLDLTVKKSKQELVCTNPFEVEYTPPRPLSKPHPPQEFGPHLPPPDGSFSSQGSHSRPSSTDSHSSQPNASRTNIPHDPNFYRRQGGPPQSQGEYKTSSRPGSGPWPSGPHGPPPQSSAQQHKSGPPPPHPPPPPGSGSSTMVARPPERLGGDHNGKGPNKGNADRDRDNQARHASVSVSSHPHPQSQSSHPSCPPPPQHYRDSQQQSRPRDETTTRPASSEQQSAAATHNTQPPPAAAQSQHSHNNNSSSQRMDRSDSTDSVPSRNHYRPPSMLQYQRRSSWSSTSSSLNNSMEKDIPPGPHQRPADPIVTAAKDPVSKQDNKSYQENNSAASQNQAPTRHPSQYQEQQQQFHGPVDDRQFNQRPAPPPTRSDPSPRSNEGPMSVSSGSRTGRETVSPAHSAPREQSSPALSRNMSPATSDQGYHQSGRSSAHSHSSESYPYYPDRPAGPEGPPTMGPHHPSQKPYPQEYNPGYGPSGRPEYGPEHNQNSQQGYDYNNKMPSPHQPNSSMPRNQYGPGSNRGDYDKYRQWRQEQKSMASAAIHAAQYPQEQQNHYPPPQPGNPDKGQRGGDARSKGYPAPGDRQQPPPPPPPPATPAQKRQANSKDKSSAPRSRKTETPPSSKSTKVHEKPKLSDEPKAKIPKSDNLFESMAKTMEKGAGQNITAKDLDVPLSLFYLPYYGMGLTEKIVKMDEDKAKEEWLKNKDIGPNLTDEESLELLRKKFPNFPHDIPKNSEIFRKLPNGVRFHRTEDLPGSREAVTRSLPVANVNPIIKEADEKEGSTGKMSVSDIIAAKISEGLQPPPSNQQSIQEPGLHNENKGEVKGEKGEAGDKDKEKEGKRNWSQVRDIASLFFPFHHVICKKDQAAGKSDTDPKKATGSAHTNFAKYIESAITKNLKLENGEEPNDQVDLTKDEDAADVKAKTSSARVKKPPESTISKPPATAPTDKEPAPEQKDKPKPPAAESQSRPSTPTVTKTTCDSEPKRSMYKSRKHYFLHRHLAEENDDSTQDEPKKPEPPKVEDEKTQDSVAESEADKKSIIETEVDKKSIIKTEVDKKSIIKTEDVKPEPAKVKTEEKPQAAKSPVTKSDSFNNDQYKLDRNIPKYPDSDSDDTWPGTKTPLDSPARPSPCYTPVDALSSPGGQQPSSPQEKPGDEGTKPSKNEHGRRRGRGRGRGATSGRRNTTTGPRGRPPKLRQSNKNRDDKDKDANNTNNKDGAHSKESTTNKESTTTTTKASVASHDDGSAAKLATQSKNADRGFGPGTSSTGPRTSKQGYCPSKTKLLKRMASREMQHKERESKSNKRRGKKLTGMRRGSSSTSSSSGKQGHDNSEEVSKHPMTRLSPRRLREASKCRPRKRASSPARLKSVLRNKRKRISYNKNAAYEEAIRKEEERKMKQLQVNMRAKELVRDQRKGVKSGDNSADDNSHIAANADDSGEETEIDEDALREATLAEARKENAERAASSTETTPTKTEVAGTEGGGEENVSRDSSPEKKRLVVCRETGETPLHKAARKGYLDVVKTEITQCDVNGRDNAGYTPLHEACMNGYLEVAKYLMDHGADLKCVSYDGTRPIHDAILGNHIEVVRLLLHSGADPAISMYSGKTPLDLARTPEMRAFLKGYLIDMNGTQERTSRVVVNDAGEEEEEHDEDFSHEIPWQTQSSKDLDTTPAFDAVKGDSTSSTVPSTSVTLAQGTPEFELFENVPLPLFNINADIQKGWRNFHLLKDVTKHVGQSRDSLLSSHPRLTCITRSKQEMITLIKNGGSLDKKGSLAYLEDRCKGEKTTFVELDNELRRILGTELCKVDLKGIHHLSGSSSSSNYHQGLSSKGQPPYKGIKRELKIEEDSMDTTPAAESRPGSVTSDEEEEEMALTGPCLDCEDDEDIQPIKQEMKKEEPELDEQQQYSPPNTRRLQAIKQQTYSFRRSKKDLGDSVHAARGLGLYSSRSNDRERSLKPKHTYRAHRSNSPKVRSTYDGVGLGAKKRDVTPSSRHTDRSVSPASARSDSPSRAKCSKPCPQQDKCVSLIETKLSSCSLSSEDNKENLQMTNRGVFAIQVFLNGGKRKTPTNRNKGIKAKGIPVVKHLNYSQISKKCLEKCFVSLLKEEGLCCNAAYIVTDDCKDTKSKFQLKRSLLEKAVKRFSNKLRTHLKKCVESSSSPGTQASSSQYKSTEQLPKDTEQKKSDSSSTSTSTSNLQRTRSYNNLAVGPSSTGSGNTTGSGRKGNVGQADPNLPVLECQKVASEDVADEDEMPKLTCAFGGQ